MKKFTLSVAALACLAAPALAAPATPKQDLYAGTAQIQLVQDRYDRDRDRGRGNDEREWRRGERLPRELRDDRYAFNDWRRANLAAPARGHRWMVIGDQYIQISIANGTIREVVEVRRADFRDRDRGPDRGGDRNERWRSRYSRAYTVNDDAFYRECRNKPDPAGALVGAVIGGLLGNAAGNRRNEAATTFAGVIAGGAIGAALTSKLDCDDRSYAYKTYDTGFNAGRANAYYDWENPRSGNRGRVHVLDYYNDEDGFRCTVYSQTVYIGGRPEEARGRACQQPDGAWAIID